MADVLVLVRQNAGMRFAITAKTGAPLAENRVALTRQVKEAADIVAVVGAYLPLTPAGPVYKAVCPFHNDHRPSLDIDPRRQRYRCWSCGKFGDVFTFVMDFEKVEFLEARAILARRFGIDLDEDSGPNVARLRMLETVRWATERYQECLIDNPLATDARVYVANRKLTGATLRAYGLGYAPAVGDWITTLAHQAGIPHENLLEVGLIAERNEGRGFYDRFRDRVMFPIRDVRGQPVGFGGRILPSSPFVTRAPKYYNSSETPLFHKSELLYGLDQARSAAASMGYLAVVEGYTDVLMAHQMGVTNVVATLGTALNAKHVQQLRRFVAKVVLVFDADQGGQTGVDRALEIFVSQDVELAIATLPDGMDPCDLLLAHGADAFRAALAKAVDALDFKLNHLLGGKSSHSIDETRRVIDAILGVMALAPEMSGQAGRVKQELVVTRIASRMKLRQETVWARLDELKREQRNRDAKTNEMARISQGPPEPKAGKPQPLERELVELLLADPTLVPIAFEKIPVDEITHPGLRKLVEALYALHQAGEPADLDSLRPRLNHPALVTKAMEMQDVGRMHSDRPAWLERIIRAFAERRAGGDRLLLRDQLSGASDDQAMELLKRLQNRQPA